MSTKHESTTTKMFRYKVILHLNSLKIAKDVDFDCRVQWKRHQAKAESKDTRLKNGVAVFNEDMILEFNISQDQSTKLYLEKKADLLPIIITESGLKSGGFARFDLAEPLNQSLMKTDKQLQLFKCPDPEGSITFALTYESLGQTNYDSNDSIDLSGSAIQTPRTPSISSNGGASTFSSVIEGSKFLNTSNKSQDVKLKKITEQPLQQKLLESQNRQQQLKKENQKLKADMLAMQKSLDKKNLEVMQKSKELASTKAHHDFCSRSGNKLQQKDQEIAKLQAKIAAFEKIVRKRQFDAIIRKTQSEETQDDSNSTTSQSSDGLSTKQLEEQNKSLREQLTASNFKIANIFNTAFEIGGPQLLDIIQGCME